MRHIAAGVRRHPAIQKRRGNASFSVSAQFGRKPAPSVFSAGGQPQRRADVLARVAALFHYAAGETLRTDEVAYHERFFSVGDDLYFAVSQQLLQEALPDVDVSYLAEREHDVDRAAHSGAVEEFILGDDDLLSVKGERVQEREQYHENSCAQHCPPQVVRREIARLSLEVGIEEAFDVVGKDPQRRYHAAEQCRHEDLAQKSPRREACSGYDAFAA